VAADLICDLCEQESAAALYTNLANGDAMAIGAACMLTFALSVAAELAVGVPDDQREQYSELMTKLIFTLGRRGDSGVSLAEPPKRQRGRPPKPKVEGSDRAQDKPDDAPMTPAEAMIGEATS
jgi:hypothetical protein